MPSARRSVKKHLSQESLDQISRMISFLDGVKKLKVSFPKLIKATYGVGIRQAQRYVKEYKNYGKITAVIVDHSEGRQGKTASIVRTLNALPTPIEKTAAMAEALKRLREETGDSSASFSEKTFNLAVKRSRHSIVFPSRVLGVNNPATNKKRSDDLISAYENGLWAAIHGYVQADVIAIDECSFTPLKAMSTGKVIVERGQRGFMNIPPVPSISTSMIVFMSRTKIESIVPYFENIEAHDFAREIDKFIKARRNRYLYFIMDGASTHKGDAEIVMASNPNVGYGFLPRYSPDTNPVESVHKTIKEYIGKALREDPPTTAAAMRERITELLKDFQVTPQTCADTCEHAFRIFDKLYELPYVDAVNSVRADRLRRRQQARDSQ
jgi:transposase